MDRKTSILRNKKINASDVGFIHGNNIIDVEDALQLLLHEDLTLSINISPVDAYKGQVVNTVSVTWTANKNLAALSINGNTISNPNSNNETLNNQYLTNDSTITVVASTNDESITKTKQLLFYYKLFYGVGVEAYSYADIENFMYSLDNRKVRNFSGDYSSKPLLNEYIWFFIPKDLGEPSFWVGGIEGGFTKINTLSMNNGYGGTMKYDIYRSVNSNLDNTVVTLK